ncbi:unnamed protein product [Closterium sp. NIES-65]|nr:unnamed protein product [Closterium sp. NIES-65]
MVNQSVPAGTAAAARLFSAESSVDSGSAGQQLIASLLVERLPVVIPKPPEWALKYETFSFERKQQYRKQYPKDFLDAASSTNAVPPNTPYPVAPFPTSPAPPLPVHTPLSSARTPLFPSVRTLLRARTPLPLRAHTPPRTHPSSPPRAHSATRAASAEGEGEEEDEYWAGVLEAPFDAPSRRTAADEANDVRSLQRALDKRLYLLLKGPSLAGQSGSDTWHFPEKLYEGEDSMRQCAERAAAASLGSSLDLYFVGNAPCAHAPMAAATAFFFRAHVLGGDFQPSARTIKDFAWVSKAEIPEYVDLSAIPDGPKLFQTLLMDDSQQLPLEDLRGPLDRPCCPEDLMLHRLPLLPILVIVTPPHSTTCPSLGIFLFGGAATDDISDGIADPGEWNPRSARKRRSFTASNALEDGQLALPSSMGHPLPLVHLHALLLDAAMRCGGGRGEGKRGERGWKGCGRRAVGAAFLHGASPPPPWGIPSPSMAHPLPLHGASPPPPWGIPSPSMGHPLPLHGASPPPPWGIPSPSMGHPLPLHGASPPPPWGIPSPSMGHPLPLHGASPPPPWGIPSPSMGHPLPLHGASPPPPWGIPSPSMGHPLPLHGASPPPPWGIPSPSMGHPLPLLGHPLPLHGASPPPPWGIPSPSMGHPLPLHGASPPPPWGIPSPSMGHPLPLHGASPPPPWGIPSPSMGHPLPLHGASPPPPWGIPSPSWGIPSPSMGHPLPLHGASPPPRAPARAAAGRCDVLWWWEGWRGGRVWDGGEWPQFVPSSDAPSMGHPLPLVHLHALLLDAAMRCGGGRGAWDSGGVRWG